MEVLERKSHLKENKNKKIKKYRKERVMNPEEREREKGRKKEKNPHKLGFSSCQSRCHEKESSYELRVLIRRSACELRRPSPIRLFPIPVPYYVKKQTKCACFTKLTFLIIELLSRVFGSGGYGLWLDAAKRN